MQGLVSRLVRLPLRAIPKRAVVPILRGEARGMRWVVGAGNHGYWLGRYERALSARLAALTPPDGTVYDIGANAGYMTLVAIAAGAGRVVAVEPEPGMAARLRTHVALNRLGPRVTVIEAAASDRAGTAAWTGAGSQGHLAPDGKRLVETIRLDDCALPPADLVKIDVEGHAGAVLRGMAGLLGTRPPLLVELHSASEGAEVAATVLPLGYRVVGKAGDAVHYAAATTP